MPTHPLRDLAWVVDSLLQQPQTRERFVDQCLHHLRNLRDGLPRWHAIAERYFNPQREILRSLVGLYAIPQTNRSSGGHGPRYLGWLTDRDDHDVTLSEEYGLLLALREGVYIGRDRAMPRAGVTSEYDWYISEGLGGYWQGLVNGVRLDLVEDDRGSVESWLRDVRLDLSNAAAPPAAPSWNVLLNRPALQSLALPVTKSPANSTTVDVPKAVEEHPPPATVSDGPEGGCRVHYQGKTIKVTGRTYQVIGALWHREYITFEALKRLVEDEVGDSTVHTWVNRANLAIRDLGVPWTWTTDGVNRIVRKLRQ